MGAGWPARNRPRSTGAKLMGGTTRAPGGRRLSRVLDDDVVVVVVVVVGDGGGIGVSRDVMYAEY